MGDMTKNISRHEVACRCGDPKCNFHSVDYLTISMVQEACDHFAEKLGVSKVVLHIHSGQRCPKHNKKEDGAKRSYHISGAALDHHIDEVPVEELYDYYCKKYPNKFGFGLYLNKDTPFVHADSRTAGYWRKIYK